MAKLSSYGRKVVAKVAIDRPILPEDIGHVTERRVLRAIMDDGTILAMRQVRFAPDQYKPKGELHDWGWHRFGICTHGETPESKVAEYVAHGWRIIA